MPMPDDLTPAAPIADATAAPPPPPRAADVRTRPAIITILVGALLLAWLVFFAEKQIPTIVAIFLLPSVVWVLLLAWWLTRRGVPRRVKWGGVLAAVVLGVIGVALAERFARQFVIAWGVPAATAAAVLFWAVSRPMPFGARRAGAVVVALLAFAPFLLIRGKGQAGAGMFRFEPRWASTAEERVAAWRASAAPAGQGAVPPTTQSPPEAGSDDWPAYRGPARDGVVRSATLVLPEGGSFPTPPILWRHPVGPGWSSFAVVGNRAFTQEQRNQQECVVCYDLNTGAELWAYSDENRFEEWQGGPGPRATPAYAAGRVYAVGPTGLLNCLDAATGTLLWQATQHMGEPGPPQWGVAGSPLVLGDRVIIAPGGGRGSDVGNFRLAAYRADNGQPLWSVPGAREGYGSPHPATLGGVEQVLVLDGDALTAHRPSDGAQLWRYDWRAMEPRAAQPVVLDDGSGVFVGMGYGSGGTRRLRVTRDGEQWRVEEVWKNNRLKPRFNDFVYREGHLYGLDEGILTCLDAADGKRVWKEGRYGYGQVMLIDAHLLVVTESGEVVVLDATPAGPRERGRFQAVEGKTWNHPVVAQGKLLVRNGEEAACFDLAGMLRPLPAPATGPAASQPVARVDAASPSGGGQ